ncbi:YibE/F family protein [Maridesulfovibrio bastinii]|uniref:YibE/F family protein n=1 Tax=Maridesulfovibrio bastinii TaxID=47157 RepID=UPI000410F1B3|nr:YibE/F family protein [Maridesulfovibrio bastinii]
MSFSVKNLDKDALLVLFFAVLTVAMYFMPTEYEGRIAGNAERVRGEILSVNNSDVHMFGMVKTGPQQVKLKILNGKFKGRVLEAQNDLLGRMDKDKLFSPGDTAFVVLSLNDNGDIVYANPQDHYRIATELWLLGVFALLLIVFGGWTGAKALLSFLFTAMAIWKILVPWLLNGYNPVILTMTIVIILCAVIIFMVAGINRKGTVAFIGAISGVISSSLIAVYFTYSLNLHGAVMPFAETLLYSGYGHLDLTKIYIAAIFLACSGAVMDLAMDVSASMAEVVLAHPGISRIEALRSGLRVGRAVVGTMTTTLLLAYSGGFITLLMAFMAQGVPVENTFNFIYVSAEVVKTIAGSFGLVAVAPFTAVAGMFIYVSKSK